MFGVVSGVKFYFCPRFRRQKALYPKSSNVRALIGLSGEAGHGAEGYQPSPYAFVSILAFFFLI